MTRPSDSQWMLLATWLAVAVVAVGCGRIDPEKELATAAERLAARDYGEAAIRLNSVVQVQPDNAEARRLRGELALVLGDYAAAADELDRARALGVPLESIALGLADAQTTVGQWERALATLDSAEAPLASNPTYWTTRAEALLRADAWRRGGGRRARSRAIERVMVEPAHKLRTRRAFGAATCSARYLLLRTRPRTTAAIHRLAPS